MKTYKVRKIYHQFHFATIEAESPEQAQERAEALTIDDCTPDDYTEWKVYSVDEASPFTVEELAFIDAYLNAVAEAPRESIVDFLLDKPVDNEYYTSIADAYGMWCFAMKFSRDTKCTI
jgi:hypothetical protein